MDSASHHSAARDRRTPPSANERRYTTISIPQPLYHEVKQAIEGTGFRSPTEFLVYVTRLSLQNPQLRGESGTPASGWNPFGPSPNGRGTPYLGR